MYPDVQSSRAGTPPPAYESRPGISHDDRGPPPAFAEHVQEPDSTGTGPASQQQSASRPGRPDTATGDPSGSPAAQPPAEAGPSRHPLSFVKSSTQAYKDRRRAREARRKVDYYEKLYGFVPKNAMTEAEWRDARERVPGTTVPFRAKPGSSAVFGLGGVGGG